MNLLAYDAIDLIKLLKKFLNEKIQIDFKESLSIIFDEDELKLNDQLIDYWMMDLGNVFLPKKQYENEI